MLQRPIVLGGVSSRATPIGCKEYHVVSVWGWVRCRRAHGQPGGRRGHAAVERNGECWHDAYTS
eukprot:2005762-Pyramimonas_sp.AAC.1